MIRALTASVLTLAALMLATAAEAKPQTRCHADLNASVCHTRVNGKLVSSTVTTGNNKPVRIVQPKAQPQPVKR